MKVKTKLLGIISILVVSIIGIGGSSVFMISSTVKKNEELKDKMEFQKEIKHIQYRLTGLSNDERGLIMTGDNEYSEGMKDKADDVLKSLDRAGKLIREDTYKANVEEIKENFKAYWGLNQQVIQSYASSSKKAESIHFGEERTLRKEVLDPSVNQLVESLEQEVEDLKAEISANGTMSEWVIITVTAVSAIVGIVLSLLLLKSILVPLRSLNQQLGDIAHGEADLTKKVIVKNKDEFGQLANSFNAFVQSLTQIVKQISSSSEQVAASSEQLSASAEESKSTSELISEEMQAIADSNMTQSEMTEQSSESIHELLDRLSSVASNTGSIADLSSSMRDKAEIGSESVHKMLEQMNFIDKSVDSAGSGLEALVSSTAEISNISSLITNISEQTNLLALNAAIEAARAGEQGKGFAVVAEEVRKLADETNKSANHIQSLVTTIQNESVETVNNIKVVQENVSSGIALSQETTGNFNEILNLVEQVASQIQEVAASTQQLTSGVEMVQNTIQTLASGSQETSAGTKAVASSTQEQLASMEEISYAAESLSQLAEELQTVINRFKY
ncbi:putative methyl-accepting chemotaxis protein YoaH [Bacillus paralicheniformis]|uniref:methyl-accepting chemotaxis protein n=1 Tax=Bacillus paralicheniformis TaxID=1648923 RepID=UPI000471FB93|nr:HAMP domain-containing methyl-accepting chemotaxis protein [Bacillus paralicheniformis]MDE1359325.1 HAMP domain-containing methyl-accepting chemotaxis protein [Bacillus paralicheniformis]MEC2100127.1 HAMP domain-containing methyl-accepting chemotaxis protein [Bacillus paralicheniformis]MEC2114269.1 HAMP domain-containing methyl-accepting chemotaxis protein [Bacillus paralicheniformis]MEC2320668.1 HAMP domain-containing methyl-accepting chemotaxis protein [Bacillus paralicheniformis]MED43107